MSEVSAELLPGSDSLIPLQVLYDVTDIEEIRQRVGGSFAKDPLMGLAIACSGVADQEAKDYYSTLVQKATKRNNLNMQQMKDQGGIERFGTMEEQEAAIDKVLDSKHKRLQKKRKTSSDS